MSTRTVMACRLCKSPRFTSMLRLPSTPPANAFQKTPEAAKALSKFPLNVMRCAACGHHQLDTVVDPKLLFSDYVYASGTSKVFVKHFAKYAQKIQAVVRASQRSVLEIGSNDGTFLEALRSTGFSVLGIEPAARLAAQANERGLETRNQFFDASTAIALAQDGLAFDVWTANNVLAHVDDFTGTLEALHHCTGEGSIGVFEVQYLKSLLEGGMFDLVYSEHLDYWLLAELVTRLPRTTEWQVSDAEVVPTHGGSLRVWVEKVNRSAPHPGPG